MSGEIDASAAAASSPMVEEGLVGKRLATGLGGGFAGCLCLMTHRMCCASACRYYKVGSLPSPATIGNVQVSGEGMVLLSSRRMQHICRHRAPLRAHTHTPARDNGRLLRVVMLACICVYLACAQNVMGVLFSGANFLGNINLM